MKKLIFVLLFGLLSHLSYSQEFFKVVTSQIQKYQDDDWVTVQTTYPERMYVIIKGYNFKITNKSESSFQAYGEAVHQTYSTHETYVWRGYDDEANECFLFMKTKRGSSELSEFSVMYTNKTCYVYSFTEK